MKIEVALYIALVVTLIVGYLVLVVGNRPDKDKPA